LILATQRAVLVPLQDFKINLDFSHIEIDTVEQNDAVEIAVLNTLSISTSKIENRRSQTVPLLFFSRIAAESSQSIGRVKVVFNADVGFSPPSVTLKSAM
jgi:hypothetical protein